MAQSNEPLQGTDRIRSLQDEDSIYQAFDSYPWSKDRMFMSGLTAILGKPGSSDPQSSLQDITTHARIFYYAQRIGKTIDFTSYTTWLANNPSHSPPDVLPEGYRAASSSPASTSTAPSPALLPWQQAAPKADLYVDKTAAAAKGSQTGGGDEPNYPMAFAEMLQLLQEGKPIPGVRDIPNTIARQPSTKPVGQRAAPRKPWERETESQPSQLNLGNVLDSEFPPVESST